MNNKTARNDEIEIDLFHIFRLLWRKAWLILIAMILFATILFSYSMFFITPVYRSSAKMYVNNSNISVGGASFSISSSELSAAKSLLEVYVIILKTRITLERVIEETGLDYTYAELNDMVSAASVNATEVFEISVTGPDPEENRIIVDKIVEILPERISDVVEGSSVRLVDHAVLPTSKIGPNCTYYAIVGMLIGAIISCGAIIILDLMDTTVRSEDYIAQRFDMPVLAVIPDAYGNRRGSYYKSYYRGGYYYSKRYGRYGNNYEYYNPENREDLTEDK